MQILEVEREKFSQRTAGVLHYYLLFKLEDGGGHFVIFLFVERTVHIMNIEHVFIK